MLYVHAQCMHDRIPHTHSHATHVYDDELTEVSMQNNLPPHTSKPGLELETEPGRPKKTRLELEIGSVEPGRARVGLELKPEPAGSNLARLMFEIGWAGLSLPRLLLETGQAGSSQIWSPRRIVLTQLWLRSS